jgi:hypothetical protein
MGLLTIIKIVAVGCQSRFYVRSVWRLNLCPILASQHGPIIDVIGAGERELSDERISGSGDFVEQV